jgi:ATP-dependent RNA helicase DDX1
MTAFEEFGVIPELAKGVDEMEWLLPTDVQAEAIPLILGGEFFSFLMISQY